MTTKTLFLACALTAGLSSAALADNRCPTIPTSEWMPVEKVIARAEALGYAVTETERDDGCWKVEGYDRNGAEIEIRLSPGTGEVVLPSKYRKP